MKYRIEHSDCLAKMKTMRDNCVDSIVTDPPYFLTNNSGTGFMGKSWDSLSGDSAVVEMFLRLMQLDLNLAEVNTAAESANTALKSPSKSELSAPFVNPNYGERPRNSNPSIPSVAVHVLTKQEVLELCREPLLHLTHLTIYIQRLPENAKFVIRDLSQREKKDIALTLASTLTAEAECLEQITTFLSTENPESLASVEKTGPLLGEKSTSVITGNAKNVILNVPENKSNATTLLLTESHKIIQRVISLPFVSAAIKLFMKTPHCFLILSEIFHSRWAKEALRVLKPGGHLLAFAGTRTYHPLASAIEKSGFQIRDCIMWCYGSGFPKSLNIGKETGLPEHEGLGTALKPAFEPAVLARKPLSESTVAKNVLKWGTGGLNIDGCRVNLGAEYDPSKIQRQQSNRITWKGGEASGLKDDHEQATYNPQGRFPANLILDEEAGALLDEQSGILKSGSLTPLNNVKATTGWSGGSQADRVKSNFEANTGGASRFFYCAKASKSDRGEGNGHPTVKPTKLMAYLCKLITPPNGLILDPFTGSGSTGVGALREGFRFFGIEMEASYVEIAKNRLANIKLEADSTEEVEE